MKNQIYQLDNVYMINTTCKRRNVKYLHYLCNVEFKINIMSKGCVYFFRHIGLSPVKIGFSSNESPISRFDSFRTYAPYGSEILGFIQTENPSELELRLHSRFSAKRLLGEWFDITEEDVKNVISLYTPIEQINEMNEFYRNWAKYIADKKNKTEALVFSCKSSTVKERFREMYDINPLTNRMQASKKLGVSRQTIHKWAKEFEQ